MAACIACGATPTTKAHLIGKPLRDAIGSGAGSATAVLRQESSDEIKVTTQHYGRRIFDLQPKVLCGECNSEWMNEFEQTALPLLTSVAKGDAVSLDDGAREIIASWALAVAIVRGESDDQATSFDADMARAFRYGGIGAVPVVVWLAHTAIKLNDDIAVPGHSQVTSAAGPEDGSLTILWLGRFAVVVGEGPLSHQAADGIKYMRSAVAQLWPIDAPGSAPITFPTPGQIENRQLLRAFDHRDSYGLNRALRFGERHPYRRTTQYRRVEPK